MHEDEPGAAEYIYKTAARAAWLWPDWGVGRSGVAGRQRAARSNPRHRGQHSGESDPPRRRPEQYQCHSGGGRNPGSSGSTGVWHP